MLSSTRTPGTRVCRRTLTKHRDFPWQRVGASATTKQNLVRGRLSCCTGSGGAAGHACGAEVFARTPSPPPLTGVLLQRAEPTKLVAATTGIRPSFFNRTPYGKLALQSTAAAPPPPPPSPPAPPSTFPALSPSLIIAFAPRGIIGPAMGSLPAGRGGYSWCRTGH